MPLGLSLNAVIPLDLFARKERWESEARVWLEFDGVTYDDLRKEHLIRAFPCLVRKGMAVAAVDSEIVGDPPQAILSAELHVEAFSTLVDFGRLRGARAMEEMLDIWLFPSVAFGHLVKLCLEDGP